MCVHAWTRRPVCPAVCLESLCLPQLVHVAIALPLKHCSSATVLPSPCVHSPHGPISEGGGLDPNETGSWGLRHEALRTQGDLGLAIPSAHAASGLEGSGGRMCDVIKNPQGEAQVLRQRERPWESEGDLGGTQGGEGWEASCLEPEAELMPEHHQANPAGPVRVPEATSPE